LLFFFLIIPTPLLLTLFPYTTLFRSARLSCSRLFCTDVDGRSIQKNLPAALPSSVPSYHLRLISTWWVCTSKMNWSLGHFSANADRKSTRLNSSHLGISYAVFCLKKK